MPDFSKTAGAASTFDLIPTGTLLWAWLHIREMKASQKGGRYLDCELTIDDNQPFARKKLWTTIMDPTFEGNSDAAKQMGAIAVTRILEAGRGANPANLPAYNVSDDYRELNGLRVAIKVKIEKGRDGYPDKNQVGEWLTPNPASQSGNKGYVALMEGKHLPASASPPPSPSGFGNVGQPAAQPSLPLASQPAPQASQPTGAGSWGVAQPAAAQPAANPAATSSWLAQANSTGPSH